MRMYSSSMYSDNRHSVTATGPVGAFSFPCSTPSALGAWPEEVQNRHRARGIDPGTASSAHYSLCRCVFPLVLGKIADEEHRHSLPHRNMSFLAAPYS